MAKRRKPRPQEARSGETLRALATRLPVLHDETHEIEYPDGRRETAPPGMFQSHTLTLLPGVGPLRWLIEPRAVPRQAPPRKDKPCKP